MNINESAQLAEQIDDDIAFDHVEDAEWVAEQKLDGHRLLLKGTGSGCVGLNRNGQPYGARRIPRALTTLALPEGLILDGELLHLDTLEFWAFDLRATDGSIDAQPLAVRRELLEKFLDQTRRQYAKAGMPQPVWLLPQAVGTRHKQTLLQRAIQNRAEGVVFKKISAPYVAGRNTDWSKFKFVHTVDAIVVALREDGKDSATLALYTTFPNLVQVGRCSLIGKGEVHVGDVVEVRYLYATEDDRLYQPCLMRVRTDKRVFDCTIDQLSRTNRTVLSP